MLRFQSRRLLYGNLLVQTMVYDSVENRNPKLCDQNRNISKLFLNFVRNRSYLRASCCVHSDVGMVGERILTCYAFQQRVEISRPCSCSAS